MLTLQCGCMLLATRQLGRGMLGGNVESRGMVRCTPFAWDSDYHHALDTLRKALCNAPVLTLPDTSAIYCYHVNATQYVLHAVLSQVQDKAQNVQGYFSHQLHNVVKWYPVFKRELSGIWDAILYLKFHLHRAGHGFLVNTHHATLCWILTQPDLTICQMVIQMVLNISKKRDWFPKMDSTQRSFSTFSPYNQTDLIAFIHHALKHLLIWSRRHDVWKTWLVI